MNQSIISSTLLSAFLLVGCGNAQPVDSDSASVGGEPAAEVKWLTDFEESKSIAAETGRPILINFTGSDWCAPCMQLKKEILSTDEFATYASEKLVLLELDFPRKKPQSEDLQRQNQQLAGDFEVSGFPTLVLLDAEGKEVKRSVGYMPGGPKKFLEWAEEAPSK